jgi:peptide/nickel transport system substrate-binding protein
MDRDNYWLRRKALTRRRFVGGAAVTGVGAAALGLVGCGDDDDDEGDETATGTATSGTSTATGTATASATGTGTATTAKQKGGHIRLSSANNTWDTFDVDRSRFTPFAVVISLTNEGVIAWDSFEQGKLRGALAESWEQVDDTTMVFKVREGATWQNKAPVNGRAATAEDIAAFITRNKDGKLKDGTEDPNFYRKANFAKVESATATDESTVTIKFSAPDPLFEGALAGAYSKVQAPEAIEAFEADYQNLSAAKIIGTGPYVLSEFSQEGTLTFDRFDKWQGDAWLDGYNYIPLFVDATAQQAAFEQKQIDAFAPTQKAVIDELLERFDGEIYDQSNFVANPMAGTYYAGTPPWSDHRTVGAFFLTIDRRSLIQQMFQGRAAMSPSGVAIAQTAFTMNERELIELPGFREDRAKDLAEAKQMWEAAGGPALGEIIIDIPDIWEGAYSGVSAQLKQQFEANLGNTFTPKIETYATITTKLVRQEYGNGRNNIWYGWISDITNPDPTLLMWQSYNSKSPQRQQFGYKVDEVDAGTDKLLTEFDLDTRRDIIKDLVPVITKEYGMGIPYNFVNIATTLRWNYLKVGESAPFVTTHNWARDIWFDQKDPTFQGRSG